MEIIIYIVLATLILVGLKLSNSRGCGLLGVVLVFIATVWIIVHTALLLNKAYMYDDMYIERTELQQHLDEQRMNSREYEFISISNKIIEFNTQLVLYKKRADYTYVSQYYDPKIKEIERVK